MSSKTLVQSLTIALALAVLFLVGSVWGQPVNCTHPATGCFNATVKGKSTQAHVTGFAQSFGSAGHKKWYTQLTVPGGSSMLTLQYSGHAHPPTGEFPIVNNHAHEGDPPRGKFVAAGVMDASLGVPKGFHSLKGTIMITSSSPDWIEGTFSYTGIEAKTSHKVTVSGAFKSKNTDM